jgi:hypothetical protein
MMFAGGRFGRLFFVRKRYTENEIGNSKLKLKIV